MKNRTLSNPHGYDFRDTARLSWEKSSTRYRPSGVFLKTVGVLVALIVLVSSIAP